MCKISCFRTVIKANRNVEDKLLVRIDQATCLVLRHVPAWLTARLGPSPGVWRYVSCVVDQDLARYQQSM